MVRGGHENDEKTRAELSECYEWMCMNVYNEGKLINSVFAPPNLKKKQFGNKQQYVSA